MKIAVKVLVSWLRELVDVPVGIGRSPSGCTWPASRSPRSSRSCRCPARRADEADAVIDFEITANRPDCLSVAGIAREVATLYDVPLRYRPAALPSGARPVARSVRCA